MTTICSLSYQGIDQSVMDAVSESPAIHLISDDIHTRYAPDAINLARPDVLLLDMDGIDKKEVLHSIDAMKHSNPAMKIIALTSATEEDALLQVLEMEIDSLLQKPAASITIAIEAVMDKHFMIPDSIKPSLVRRIINMKESSFESFTIHVKNHFALTSKESQVAYQLKQGLKNKQIAEKLQMPHGSVKVLVSRIYRRTGCKTREDVGRLLLGV